MAEGAATTHPAVDHVAGVRSVERRSVQRGQEFPGFLESEHKKLLHETIGDGTDLESVSRPFAHKLAHQVAEPLGIEGLRDGPHHPSHPPRRSEGAVRVRILRRQERDRLAGRRGVRPELRKHGGSVHAG